MRYGQISKRKLSKNCKYKIRKRIVKAIKLERIKI